MRTPLPPQSETHAIIKRRITTNDNANRGYKMAKILLAEDDNNLREIYQARLIAEGYEVVTAQDGEEALAVAKQHQPDLIISDVMMPRISGFEMLDILRNTDGLRDTKVIMLTALGQADDRGRADNLGADKYLVKSQVTLEDIVTSAKQMLEGPMEPQSPTPTTPGVQPGEPTNTTDATPINPVADAPMATDPTSVAYPVSTDTVVEPTTTTDVTPDPVADNASAVSPLEPTASTTDTTNTGEATSEAIATPPTDPATLPELTESVAEAPDVAAAEASVTDSAPSSVEAEEQALQAQIEGLVGTSTDEVASPVTPIEVPEGSQLPETPLLADTAETSQTVEPVASPMAGSAPTPETVIASEAPAPETSTNEVESPASVNGLPVVESSVAEEKPSLEELVAKELATEEGAKISEFQDQPASDNIVQPVEAVEPAQIEQAETEQPDQPRVINPDINNMAL